MFEECENPNGLTQGEALIEALENPATTLLLQQAQPAPPAPEAGEVAMPSDELMQQWKEECKRLSLESDYAIPASNFMAQQVVAWARQQLSAPAPAVVAVAVSERLPKPGDCKYWKGYPERPPWCWVWHCRTEEWFRLSMSQNLLNNIDNWDDNWSHWATHHAIPLPQAGEVEA
jgi:hypothetical protein